MSNQKVKKGCFYTRDINSFCNFRIKGTNGIIFIVMKSMDIIEQKYLFAPAPSWANPISDTEITNHINNTEFALQQLKEERDFCYFLNRTYYTTDHEMGDYMIMVYTLSQPASLEGASIYELLTEEQEYYSLNRISVYRNGELIDKIPDSHIKVLDAENPGGNRVFSSAKKIHVNIRDLHLNDVLILESTRHRVITDKDFLRKRFDRFVWSAPDTYWAYGTYDFKFINNRSEDIKFRKSFFRDLQGELLPQEEGIVSSGSDYQFSLKDYITSVDASREVYPFIDFVTNKSYKELSNFIYPIYEEVSAKHDLAVFAPDLVKQLDGFENVEDRIQYAIEYVQNSIYYIYNSDEMDGHKPQEASITYQNKQGDCKAKTVLLKAILAHIGVESSIVLVNLQNDFFLPYYLPSLFAFNHVVNKIMYEGQEYFIDPTQTDQYGYLAKRGFVYFKYYLEIAPDSELTTRPFVTYPDFAIEEKVNFNVEENIGELHTVTKLRYNRANNMRNYFKRTNKKELIDSWNSFLFGTLNYHSDRNNTDPRDVFRDVSLQITNDDKKENELTVEYSATIENPYFADSGGKKFLMYYDHNVYKGNVRDYKHRDVPLWHSFDTEKYEINLYTDKRINTEEFYTRKECSISNQYFSHSLKKKISKNGGTAYVEYRPIANVEVPFNDLENLKQDYTTLSQSNFGLGIDILPPGVFDFFTSMFKKKK